MGHFINMAYRLQGPVLSSIFAVYELLKEGLLDVNVIFLVEGEEESGSVGFVDAVEQHKAGTTLKGKSIVI